MIYLSETVLRQRPYFHLCYKGMPNYESVRVFSASAAVLPLTRYAGCLVIRDGLGFRSALARRKT